MAGGQTAELQRWIFLAKPHLYCALGAKGIARVNTVIELTIGENGAEYKLRPGLNAVNADKVIQDHGDICKPAIASLIWRTARHKP
jgi:hypothetical protein